MCGRFTQAKPIEAYMEEIVPGWPHRLLETREPNWNLAPTAPAWTIRIIEEQPVPSLLKWGFGMIDGEKGLAPINARIETAPEKYLFRKAWTSQRCVVPADGWYEWKAEAGGKQPYYFTRKDGKPSFFAGLWTANTYCLFTTASDGQLTAVHDRKPLALEPADALTWIEKGMASADELIAVAVKAPSLLFHPVSKAVSNWRNNGPDLIERAGAV